MATKKKAEVEPEKLKPVKKASSEKPPKKDKLLEAVVDVAVEEKPHKIYVHETVADVLEEYDELMAEQKERESSPFVEPDCDGTVMGLPVVAEIPETSSGLLAHFPGGETREPTHDELIQIGRAMAERMFGNRNVQAEPVAKPDAPPKPKVSGNHCRLCKSFAGNDPRGALWSDGGMCLTYNHVQMPVEPEHYCGRFVFDEALRDAEPR